MLPVENMTNESLFRALISLLWSGYDAGGISIGRSVIATMLEGFMDLFPREPNLDVHQLGGGNIFKEIDRRIKKLTTHPDEMLGDPMLPFTGPEILSDQEFALISLREICDWHKNEAEAAEFFNLSLEDAAFRLRNFCEAIFPEISRELLQTVKPDRKSIMTESNARTRIAFASAERLRSFKDLKINPWFDRIS